MEEEDEEPEATGPSDLGGVPWKEAVELHTKLKGESDPGAAEDDDGLHDGDGEMDEDKEEEEDDEDEDEEEEEEESSDGKHRVCAVVFIVLVKVIKVSLHKE